MNLPLDIIDEWRGTVSNPNASMSRSSGGQYSFSSATEPTSSTTPPTGIFRTTISGWMPIFWKRLRAMP